MRLIPALAIMPFALVRSATDPTADDEIKVSKFVVAHREGGWFTIPQKNNTAKSVLMRRPDYSVDYEGMKIDLERSSRFIWIPERALFHEIMEKFQIRICEEPGKDPQIQIYFDLEGDSKEIRRDALEVENNYQRVKTTKMVNHFIHNVLYRYSPYRCNGLQILDLFKDWGLGENPKYKLKISIHDSEITRPQPGEIIPKSEIKVECIFDDERKLVYTIGGHFLSRSYLDEKLEAHINWRNTKREESSYKTSAWDCIFCCVGSATPEPESISWRDEWLAMES